MYNIKDNRGCLDLKNLRLTFNAFSALVNLAADTIFIEDVIFLMFFTLFSRVSMSFKVAIPLAPEGVRDIVVRSHVVAISISVGRQSENNNVS